ncbi:MAG: glycosyltransferase [Nitrospira sp.]|nr:glycosyltransferase [Nitrospira sp.]MDH4302529.1 glycosyltransferase [Nitrospira sp.]MDH5193338.1 glycosyltransferase [Nitrospira sp.]
MNDLANPSTDVTPSSAAVGFCPEGSPERRRLSLTLVQEAAGMFQDTWMPLETCLALRDGLAAESQEPDQLAAQFQTVCQKPERLRAAELHELIAPELLGGWALSANTVDYLVEKIQECRPTAILEFGSGTSSLALAWAMKRVHGASARPPIFSIDQSLSYIERTKSLLDRHGLAGQVRFLQADLVFQTVRSRVIRCYHLPHGVLEEFFGGARPEIVLVDGPAGENGIRFGTVPLVREFLASGARVFLDDGLRDSELDTADLWNQLGYVQWQGVRWEGKGLLSGRVRPVFSPPLQQWLENVQLLNGPRQRFASLSPAGRLVHHRDEGIPCSPPQTTPSGTISQLTRPLSLSSPRQERPMCLFLNTYYHGFLDHHYRMRPELRDASYESQHQALQAACFGDSDFYSSGLSAVGWEAGDLIVNCRPLQDAWAKVRGLDKGSQTIAVAVEQIRELKPQVLYLQDLGIGTQEFMNIVRPHVELIVGQIASPIPPHAHLEGFDILISSFPHFVDDFRRNGRVAYYQPLAFDPRLLQRLGNCSRQYPLSFVGGVSPAHRERQALLVALAKSLPLHCWGYGTQALVQEGVEGTRLHGDVWGMDMFSVLARSAITVNHHIDVAKSNANNMRLFEATGCGALLVTDYKDNLTDLFEIGSEVVAYRSVEECADLLSYYLQHKDEAAEIAKRGQRRTLRDHTYQTRMCHTGELLDRHLRRKIGNNRLPDPDLDHISYGRAEITPSQVTAELAQSWRSDRIPSKQRALVQRELQDMYSGNPPLVFQVLADALRPHVRPNIELLEIGCASGYYYEVLEYLLKTRLSYVGIDFSDAMIRLARAYYPLPRFEVGDGSALRFQEQSIPIVISSGVLLHVREYAMHIAEAARVASEVVVLHRTPIARRTATRHFKKFAYGVETFELRFSEGELLELCRNVGLELITRHEFDSRPERDEFEITYAFRAATE